MQNELFDAMDRLLKDIYAPELARRLVHDRQEIEHIWEQIHSSGFLDLMVSEADGGAGLGWPQAWEVLFAVGRHALPFPLGQTMWARSQDGPIAQSVSGGQAVAISGFGRIDSQGRVRASGVAGATLADFVLVQVGREVFGAAAQNVEIEPVADMASFDGNVSFTAGAPLAELPEGLLSEVLAVILSIQLAGCADRVLQMTLDYAGTRVQFGKPIGRFQALQQQISEMAEHVMAMRMASQMAVQQDHGSFAMRAAMAKLQTSMVAAQVARVAHAVHGAIGVTWAFDLQIYTRKLYEWARLGAGQGYWSSQLGRQVIGWNEDLVDFVRTQLFGVEISA